MIFRVGTARIDLASPVVMTIVNVTPDSFFAGSRTSETEAIRKRVAEAVGAGAALLDVGGYSSRPGAAGVPPAEEARRLHNALEVIRADFPDTPVSLDTFRAEVADEMIRAHGPCIVNDITGGTADPEIVSVAARHGVPFVAMHMRGTPQTMQRMTDYDDVTEEVLRDLQEKVRLLHAAGVGQVIVDPGFGFSKTVEQNYELLSGLHRLAETGCPILAGISRKSMIWKPLGITPAEALPGTTALHWECLRQGANILRVHDTLEAVQTVRLFNLFRAARGE